MKRLPKPPRGGTAVVQVTSKQTSASEDKVITKKVDELNERLNNLERQLEARRS